MRIHCLAGQQSGCGTGRDWYIGDEVLSWGESGQQDSGTERTQWDKKIQPRCPQRLDLVTKSCQPAVMVEPEKHLGLQPSGDTAASLGSLMTAGPLREVTEASWRRQHLSCKAWDISSPRPGISEAWPVLWPKENTGELLVASGFWGPWPQVAVVLLPPPSGWLWEFRGSDVHTSQPFLAQHLGGGGQTGAVGFSRTCELGAASGGKAALTQASPPCDQASAAAGPQAGPAAARS